MFTDLPLILIEVVLVFGGALGFAWWQLRDVKRDGEKARAAAEVDHGVGATSADTAPTRDPSP